MSTSTPALGLCPSPAALCCVWAPRPLPGVATGPFGRVAVDRELERRLEPGGRSTCLGGLFQDDARPLLGEFGGLFVVFFKGWRRIIFLKKLDRRQTQGRETIEPACQSGRDGNCLGRELLLEILLDAHGCYPFQISGARAEGQTVERVDRFQVRSDRTRMGVRK